MLISDLVAIMERIAPLEYAEPWDKVGLLVGDRSASLRGPVLLTIDLNEAVLSEAVEMNSGAIVAYHPPIFEPLAKITDATPRQRVILRALQHNIAIYSPHTALDAIPGGVADWLCEGLSGSKIVGKIEGDCRALSHHARVAHTQEVKIVTFVPAKDAEHVRNALASAGAGRIGAYQVCSFATEGTGTFLGDESTNPTVGQRGVLETVREVRLEMVASKSALALALETLRKFHPYESPAIDAYELLPQPQRFVGAGRRLTLDKPTTVQELAQRLKAWVGRDQVRYALTTGPLGDDKPIMHVGVVPGAGGELSRLARQEGCDLFVTGEMKHHDVLGALNSGMSVILGGHTSTERGYLPRLRDTLESRVDVPVAVSKTDRTPLVAV
jgi:dinuclear metal center YbgI/SA1388 family protein